MSLLLNRWTWVLGAIAVMAIAWGVTAARLNHCKESLAEAHRKVAELEGAYLHLAQVSKRQNEAVEQWQRDAKLAGVQARQAIERARVASVDLDRDHSRLEALLHASAPERTCQDALAEVRKGLWSEPR